MSSKHHLILRVVTARSSVAVSIAVLGKKRFLKVRVHVWMIQDCICTTRGYAEVVAGSCRWGVRVVRDIKQSNFRAVV